jgi:hypothetical protein
MAFTIRNLSVLAYANGFTLWHYKAGQNSLEHLAEPGFFSDAVGMLAAGDIVMVSAAEGASMLCVETGADNLPQLAKVN